MTAGMTGGGRAGASRADPHPRVSDRSLSPTVLASLALRPQGFGNFQAVPVGCSP